MTKRTFDVVVNGDVRNETDETFLVGLANPSKAAIDVGTGTGTIVNDDPLPKLSVDSVSHNEGDTGTTTYTFTVSALGRQRANRDRGLGRGERNRAPGGQRLSDRGRRAHGRGRRDDTDVRRRRVGRLAERNRRDVPGEPREPVECDNRCRNRDGNHAVNDDPLPKLSVDSVSHDEGDSGRTTYAFTVSLSAVSGQTVTVDWAAGDGSALVADGDYDAAGGTLTFAPGETSHTVSVLVNGDARSEIEDIPRGSVLAVECGH